MWTLKKRANLSIEVFEVNKVFHAVATLAVDGLAEPLKGEANKLAVMTVPEIVRDDAVHKLTKELEDYLSGMVILPETIKS